MAGPGTSLALKLVEIMAAVERIPKNGWNDFHKYHYALEADILEALRGELSQRGVLLIPAVVGRSRDAVGEKGTVVTHLDMEFTFMDAETGETLTRPWCGAGADKEDKGAYKAMTGGEKYFLLKMFLILTGDDPEAEGEQKPRQQQARPQTQPTAPRQTQAPPAQRQAVAPAAGLRVADVKEAKKGSSEKGPWTLYIVKLSTGVELKTFDDKTAQKAREAQTRGLTVDVQASGDKLSKLTLIYPAA